MATYDGNQELIAPDIGTKLATAGNKFETPNSGGVIYFMRAYDETLTETVFWQADSVDGTGSQYSGPGPLNTIVVLNIG